jgi:hypothetical protein
MVPLSAPPLQGTRGTESRDKSAEDPNGYNRLAKHGALRAVSSEQSPEWWTATEARALGQLSRSPA